MILSEAYITVLKIIPKKSFIEMVQQVCEETESKPLYCELPDDLKLKSISGSVQTYTYTNSLVTVSGMGISTTTF